MAASRTFTLAGWIVMAACSSSGQRRATEDDGVAKEIRRICALPESERQTEIQKIKDASGVVVACSEQ
jgi:hypothetical protein